MTYKVIPLTDAGEGRVRTYLGDALVEFVTRYNHSAECWSLDVLDENGVSVLNGLMLVPGVDLLSPWPELKTKYGALVTVELNVGDYTVPRLLGSQVQLLWFASGEPVVLP